MPLTDLRHAAPAGWLLALLLAPAVTLAAGPWPAVAREDLAFVQASLRDNHPGAIDEENPDFRVWLDQGYRQALDLAGRAESLEDAVAAVRFYIAGFADGHTSFSPAYQPLFVRWPGFVLVRRGERFMVHHVESREGASLPAVGAEITACDGQRPDDLLDQRVLRFRDGRASLASTRSRFTPLLLVDTGVSFLKPLTRCTISAGPESAASGQSAERRLALEWRSIRASDLMPILLDASFGASSPPFGISEPSPGRFWVSAPTFHPSDQEVSTFNTMMDRLPALRTADLVVFDVRGNQGGNSAWGTRLAKGLYGEELVSWVECSHPDRSYAEWRVSTGNRDHMRAQLPLMARQLGPESDVVATFTRLVDDLTAALERGTSLVVQSGARARAAAEDAPRDCADPAPASPVRGRVMLLTDGLCGSACLDFADLLLKIPGVVHAGQPTSADTVYMDIRDEALPSGLGQCSIAQKVYRNRPRGHNEPYVPALVYEGAIGDMEAVQRWLLSVDLGPKG